MSPKNSIRSLCVCFADILRPGDEPDCADGVSPQDQRQLRRLLQLRHQDPPDGALSLRHPHLLELLHLPGNTEVRQNTPVNAMPQPVTKRGDQVRQHCGEFGLKSDKFESLLSVPGVRGCHENA